jgi:glycosyltransferase involved in cell wall biosynthesis
MQQSSKRKPGIFNTISSRGGKDQTAVADASRGCDLSIVIPLYNEVECVALLCERLSRILASLSLSSEVILIDDGSRDGTSAQIRRILPGYPTFRLVRLRKNFGQTAALAAGFDHARGGIVVTMDGDLQNSPEDIPKLLAKLDEGYDLVSGWRVNRQDSFLFRVFPSRVANRIIGWITGTQLHDYGCSLKAYRQEILQDIQIHGDMHRFLPAFAGALGARIAEIPVTHFPRKSGISKYGLWRTLIVLVDMISIRFLLPYAFKPLKSFGFLGISLLGAGMGISLYLTYLRLFAGEALSDRPLLLLGVLLIVMGVQFLALGILVELQTRILHDRDRGTYAVLERAGFSGKDAAHDAPRAEESGSQPTGSAPGH